MKTVTLQIGNSDDKLTQYEWSKFVVEVASLIALEATKTHFFGCSHGAEEWQNAAWVFEATNLQRASIHATLALIRSHYQQESVAWTEGDTLFI